MVSSTKFIKTDTLALMLKNCVFS